MHFLYDTNFMCAICISYCCMLRYALLCCAMQCMLCSLRMLCIYVSYVMLWLCYVIYLCHVCYDVSYVRDVRCVCVML